MRAGELRHRVTIQQKSVVRGTYGEEDVAWTDVATVWGSVEPLQGREFIEAKQTQAEITTRIRIRYRSGISPEMRAVWDGHIYDIEAVIDVGGRKRELQLMCTEVT